MRCDLRDCRLAALSLVGSWLMIDVIHGVTLENQTLERGAENPNSRKEPA